MTFETIPPPLDSDDVSTGVPDSRSKLGAQELTREWERDRDRARGERPTDMI